MEQLCAFSRPDTICRALYLVYTLIRMYVNIISLITMIRQSPQKTEDCMNFDRI